MFNSARKKQHIFGGLQFSVAKQAVSTTTFLTILIGKVIYSLNIHTFRADLRC